MRIIKTTEDRIANKISQLESILDSWEAMHLAVLILSDVTQDTAMHKSASPYEQETLRKAASHLKRAAPHLQKMRRNQNNAIVPIHN